MIRLLGLALLLYLPHLAEEALTGMHDDPLIVAGFAPLAHLSPRHATYLVFQVMIALTLVAAYLAGKGGRAQLFVIAVVGVSLVAEGHHVVRAVVALAGNSGLLTSLPMPILGVYLLRRVVRAHRAVVARAAGANREGRGYALRELRPGR